MSQERRYGSVIAAAAWAFCLCELGCSRSSLLLELGERATGEPSQAGKTSGGSHSTGFGGSPSGGTFGQGGTFGTAATSGFQGGGFSSGGFPSGGVASGGAGLGGQTNDACELAVGDCRLETDAGCEGVRHACEGVLLAHLEFGTAYIVVNDVATATSGRVAVVGSFFGTLALGGKSQTLSTGAASASQGFVASFDAAGQAEWAKMYVSSQTGQLTGVRFSPKGNVIAQVKDDAGMAALQLDAQGEVDWLVHSSSAVGAPGRVGVDNDGNVLLGGTYAGPFDFADAHFDGVDSAGYLLKLNDAGQLLWARSFIPDNWQSATNTSLVVDDEDSVLVGGVGRRDAATAVQSAFFQKFSPTGELRLSNELDASNGIDLRGLAVDREMRPIVAAQFEGGLQLEDEIFLSGSEGPDLWVAQYSREGKLAWQRAYSSKHGGTRVDAAAVDPFGNIVLAGNSASLWVDGLQPLVSSGSLYALKLRPDGAPVWLRSFVGSTGPAILASDIKGNFWLGSTFSDKLSLDTDVLDGKGDLHGLLLKLGP